MTKLASVTLRSALAALALVLLASPGPAAEDLDGDGNLDAVFGNANGPNQVSLGDGAGGFFAPGSVAEAVTRITYGVALGDLDGDGNLDVVFANVLTPNRVLLGDGAGGFAPGSDPEPGLNLVSLGVALGDLNGDGNLDAVFANASTPNRVLLGDGAGGFAPGSDVEALVVRSEWVALGDLDGDGNLDAVFANSVGSASRVLLGDGAGGFAPGSDVEALFRDSRSVALGDLDGDGNLDAVFANLTSGAPAGPNRVLLGDGAGGFGPGTDVEALTRASTGLALGDLDGDGDLDAVFANALAPNRVLLGDGMGGFAPGSDVEALSSFSNSVALGDVNGDGNLDAVFAENNAHNRLLLGDGLGGFASGSDIVGTQVLSSIAVALEPLPPAQGTIVPPTPVVTEDAKLTASDAQNSDLFGGSVSLDSNTMVVGATEASAAYVYTLDAAGAWTETAKLEASDAGGSDEFGRAVGVSEDTIVVGARANDSEGVNTGSAYVFTRDAAGAWTQAAKLVASDAGDFDFFGTAVAVSGDTVVVAAHFDDDANVNAGAAYVFTRDAAGNWPQTTKLVAPEAVVFALLGENAVAICGDTIVAGAPSDGPGGSRSGSAYVFTRDAAGVWAKTAKLTAADPSSPGFFGNGVGISGDTIVVGAWYDDSVAGAAYIFTRDAAGAWTESAKLVASDSLAGDHFGWQVGISADTAVVGAYQGGLNSFGSAYVFTPDASGVWTETAKLLASDPFLHDAFGISVAVSGGVAAIGAVAEETPPQVSTGSVYVFDVPNTNIPSDTTPPTVTITSPADQLVTSATSVTLGAEVVDDSGTTVTSTPAGVAPGTLPAGGGSVSGSLALAADGENILAVSATDEAVNTAGTSIAVYRDTVSPAVMVSPAEGTVVGLASLTLSITVTDQTLTDVTVDAVSAGQATVAGGDIYGVSSLDPPSFAVTLLEGSNSIDVVAIDAAGNETTVTRTVILDLTAPVVEITAPLNGACYDASAATEIPLSADIDDATATDVTGDLTDSHAAGGGTSSGTFTLSEGSNTISVTATNPGLGLSSSDSVTVTLDTILPTVEITTPDQDDCVSGTIEFHADATDVAPGAVDSTTYFVDGVVISPAQTEPDLYLVDTTLLAEGSHTLRVDATDACGNVGTMSITVDVDNTPPDVTITTPVDLAWVSGTIGFDANASDSGTGVASITMTAAGLPLTTTGSVSSTVDTLAATAGIDGELELEVTAVDCAGNETTVSVTVQVDNTDPAKAITAPADGSKVRCLLDITADVNEANLASVQIAVDGVLSAPLTAPYAVSFDTRDRLDGDMEITLVATDLAGNVSTCSINVTVDNLRVKLKPKTLQLKSRGGNKSMKATIEGQSADLLIGLDPADITLCIPGGSPIAATSFHGHEHGWRCEDEHGSSHRGRRKGHRHGHHGHESKVHVKFDRQLVIGALRVAGITNGKIEMTIKATVGGTTYVLGSQRVRVRSKGHH